MSSFTFLLVDDEKEFAETVARRLRRRGFRAECVFSGTDALMRLEKDDKIDVVILDIGMPDLDGMKTLETVRKKYPLVEVIILTGQSAFHTAVESLKSGAFDYLIKPCELDILISKAEQAVSRKKEREPEILRARMKPYISKRERDELISQILEKNKHLK